MLKRSSEPCYIRLIAIMTASPKHGLVRLPVLKIKALSLESEYFTGPDTKTSNKKQLVFYRSI